MEPTPEIDDWNKPALPLPLPGASLLRPLLDLIRGPSEHDLLRLRLLRAQLAQLQGPTAYAPITFEQFIKLLAPRSDVCVLGKRGSGKTATAWAITNDLADLADLAVLAPGWPTNKRPRLPRANYSPAADWTQATDAVALIDEAALVVGVGKRDATIWEALAIARHNVLSTIWTSQDAASLRRELLRLDPVLVWCDAPSWASALDRPELDPLVKGATAVLEAMRRDENPGARAAYIQGRWVGFNVSLPGWFRPEHSTIRRRTGAK